MTATQTTAIHTTCSDCTETVVIANGEASVRIPSNGKRGSLHVPARVVRSDVYNDGDLLTWDCPACEYADSFDLHQ